MSKCLSTLAPKSSLSATLKAPVCISPRTSVVSVTASSILAGSTCAGSMGSQSVACLNFIALAAPGWKILSSSCFRCGRSLRFARASKRAGSGAWVTTWSLSLMRRDWGTWSAKEASLGSVLGEAIGPGLKYLPWPHPSLPESPPLASQW